MGVGVKAENEGDTLMWSYYGSKANVIGWYPPPMHDKIIEPFAGTARYALKYWDEQQGKLAFH